MSEDRRHNQAADAPRPLAELLSAYLDDRADLSNEELAQVELALTEDPVARQIHAELGVIRQELRSLEPLSAPRSYHLDAEMVGAPEPIVLQETSAWYVRQAATVRWATAAAAILFVFVLGADLVLNNAFSDPADPEESAQTSQSEMMVRQADGDDAAADDDVAADTGMEAIEDEAGDDAGGGDAAPPIMTPEVAGDGSNGTAGETASDPAALAPAPGADGDDAEDAEPDVAQGGAADIEAESAQDGDLMAFNADKDSTASETSDRRLWRVAEFSLVVLLGLLITAMIALPRLGRASTRTVND